MYAALTTPEPFEMEYRIVRGDGEVRHVYSRAEVALASADAVAVAGLRGICQDITERARAAYRAEDDVRGRLRRELRVALDRIAASARGLAVNGDSRPPAAALAIIEAVAAAGAVLDEVTAPPVADSPPMSGS
jgi:hypothetical protein